MRITNPDSGAGPGFKGQRGQTRLQPFSLSLLSCWRHPSATSRHFALSSAFRQSIRSNYARGCGRMPSAGQKWAKLDHAASGIDPMSDLSGMRACSTGDPHLLLEKMALKAVAPTFSRCFLS